MLLARLTRRRQSRAVLRIELGALLLLSIGSLVFRLTEAGPHINLAHALPGTFDWFAVGMALAVVSAVAFHEGTTPAFVRFVQRRPTLLWLGAFAALNLAALYSKTTGRYDLYTGRPLHYVWLLIATCVVLPAFFPGESRGLPHRFLALRPVAWLGLVSYGIYLYHYSIVEKVTGAMNHVGLAPHASALPLLLVVSVAASALVGGASYYVVERPFLNLKETRASRARARAADSSEAAPAPVAPPAG